MTQKIERVALVGGTNGNEFLGGYLVKKFQKSPELVARSTFLTEVILANPKALQEARRYIDKDLNRCFLKADLENPLLCNYEENRAKWLNQKLGPKGNASVDFLIDLHSSISYIGITLILSNFNFFNLQLASYLCSNFSNVKVCSFKRNDQEVPSINSLCPLGFAIEIGSVIPSTLDPVMFQKYETLIQAILDYLDTYNQKKTELNNETITVYKTIRNIGYPKNSEGEIEAMIHPSLIGQDFQELNPGEPIFLGFNGQTFLCQEKSKVWPVFINEAAYFEKNIAMYFTQKEQMNILSFK